MRCEPIHVGRKADRAVGDSVQHGRPHLRFSIENHELAESGRCMVFRSEAERREHRVLETYIKVLKKDAWIERSLFVGAENAYQFFVVAREYLTLSVDRPTPGQRVPPGVQNPNMSNFFTMFLAT